MSGRRQGWWGEREREQENVAGRNKMWDQRGIKNKGKGMGKGRWGKEGVGGREKIESGK